MTTNGGSFTQNNCHRSSTLEANHKIPQHEGTTSSHVCYDAMPPPSSQSQQVCKSNTHSRVQLRECVPLCTSFLYTPDRPDSWFAIALHLGDRFPRHRFEPAGSQLGLDCTGSNRNRSMALVCWVVLLLFCLRFAE